jgi:hypothetical protein
MAGSVKTRFRTAPPAEGTKVCKYDDHQGERRLPLEEFPVVDRDEEGRPAKWHSWCRLCRNAYMREYKAQRREDEVTLELMTFRAWLNHMVMANSISGVASAVGVSPKTVKAYLDGVYRSVDIFTVDQFVTPFGLNYKHLYPDA